MLTFSWPDNPLMMELRDIFNELLPEALYKSHYELATETSRSASEWKLFLLEPSVSDYIESELRILQNTELAKLLKDVGSGKNRTVGMAQTLTALMKVRDNASRKEGDTVIYTYVPANAKEQQAPNFKELNYDPFKPLKKKE